MLRSRSASSRTVLRSVAAVAVVLSLFLASRAFAGTSVVVAGPDGSARITAIVAELRARGFDVVIEGAAETAGSNATVRVGVDGSVLVIAGAHRETYAASEGDDVLARRIAEAIRAADSDAPGPSADPPEPEPAPPPTPAPPPEPLARNFALAGTWLLSVDDALPLLAVGGGSPVSSERILRIGDPTFGARTSPKPMSLDVAVANRVTVGGTVLLQTGGQDSIIGAAARLGYVLPLSDRLALWPRLGVAHASALGGDWSLPSRTDLVAEARLVWTVSSAWALTLGPSFAVAVQTGEPADRRSVVYVGGGPAANAVSYPVSAPARVGVAIGITGRLGGGAEEPSARASAQPRFFVGVERAMPLLRYRVETATTPSSDLEPKSLGDVGTADVTPISPQTPRLAFDVRVAEKLTVGVAGSAGYVRTSVFASSLLPSTGGPEILAWTLAPRVGWRSPVSSFVAFWPRLGLSYANAATSRSDATGDFTSYHLGMDVDGFVVLSPIEGVGFMIGPSLELPISGARRLVSTDGYGTTTIRRQEQATITLAVSAGLVVSLP